MNTPKQIALETVRTIVKELIEDKRGTKLKDDEVNKILQKHITAAYIEAGEDQKKEIYRALSLNLHPDKISQHYPTLYAYLHEKKMSHAPFNWVNELNTVDLFNEITNDPISGLSTSYHYVLKKLTPLFSTYERYWQPFKLIAQIASWLVLIPIFTAMAATGVGFFIITFIIKYAEKLCIELLDKVMQGQYKTELKEHLNPNFRYLKQAHLDFIRQQGKESLINENMNTAAWDNMSDEALFDLLIDKAYAVEIIRLEQLGVKNEDYNSLKKAVEEQYNQKILEQTPIVGFIKLKLIFLSIYNTIKKWSSQNSLLFKVLQPITSPFFIASVAVIEFIRFLNTAVLFVAIGSLLLGMIASIGIINAPLYTVDLIRYISNKLRSSEANENSAYTANSTSIVPYEPFDSNKGALSLLRLAQEEQKSVKKDELYNTNHAFGELFKEIDKFEQNMMHEENNTVVDMKPVLSVPTNS